MIEAIFNNGQIAGPGKRTLSDDQETLYLSLEGAHHHVMDVRQSLIHEIHVDAPESPSKARLYDALNDLSKAEDALWRALSAYSSSLVDYIAEYGGRHDS